MILDVLFLFHTHYFGLPAFGAQAMLRQGATVRATVLVLCRYYLGTVVVVYRYWRKMNLRGIIFPPFPSIFYFFFSLYIHRFSKFSYFQPCTEGLWSWEGSYFFTLSGSSSILAHFRFTIVTFTKFSPSFWSGFLAFFSEKLLSHFLCRPHFGSRLFQSLCQCSLKMGKRTRRGLGLSLDQFRTGSMHWAAFLYLYSLDQHLNVSKSKH